MNYNYAPETAITDPRAPRSPAKCVLIVDRVTYSQSCIFVQPLANPADSVLNAFDWDI